MVFGISGSMNVLDCFGGMSCGQIALNQLGIKYNNYYTSEIDKYAIKVTQANYPNTIQLGNIENWQDWDLLDIDLVIGGSPCQGFSYAGKGLNFDDPRSKLFFTFEKILKHYQPKWFLLENVIMLQKWQDIISQRMGRRSIRINSSLVSAQNRNRLYWTNIKNELDMFGMPYCNIEQPKDRHIYLKDIIEEGFIDRTKSYSIKAGYSHGVTLDDYFNKRNRQIVFDNIIQGGAIRGRYLVNGKRQDHKMKTAGLIQQRLETRTDQKSNTLTSIEKDSVIVQNELSWRKLTVRECARLQTIPEHIIDTMLDCGVSNSQLYKMLGNGWTINVITHILQYIKESI